MSIKEQYTLYEQISLTYLHEQNYAASVHFFLFCVKLQPEHSNAWYGLGDAICELANEQKSGEIYDLGVSFIKKSLSIDPNNEYPRSILAMMTQSTDVGPQRIQGIPTFNEKNISEIKERFTLKQEALAASFKSCSDDNRIRLAMFLCDVSDHFSFNLLNEAVINDKNLHVKLAIMKRLYVYSAHPPLKETFEYLAEENRWRSYNPYFYLTLKQISYILPQINKTDWATKILEAIDPSQIHQSNGGSFGRNGS
ncbi:tetratricopeptide repeat protein [Pedobacter gandavensis]|uniref:Tetratricopeptide repeat protein n=1 Tax=Pedobacter gandavensis TaxID=2679963 RepID=A0ABR6ETQ0_9SPHI|nr:hypothetical protein [Pedobacter gandavensis]MBB2148641.1 hypothetical protein [Pedobacter gandavensis]